MESNSVNPKTIDKQMKTACVNQNVYKSAFQEYKICPCVNSIKFCYVPDYDPTDEVPRNIANTIVLDKHPLDVIVSISQKGMDALTSNQPYPVMIYPMGRDFIGTNYESREGVYDETVMLRTNYALVMKKTNGLFPIKDEKEVIYSKYVTMIRNQQFAFVKYEDLVKMGVITVFVPDNIEQIENENGHKILSSESFLKFQMTIESAFQAAICGCHTVIVLTIFSNEFNIPTEDQLKIYNLCILKYGTKFSNIVMAIPKYEDQKLTEYFEKNLMKPHELTQSVDAKYETEKMKQKITQKQS